MQGFPELFEDTSEKKESKEEEPIQEKEIKEEEALQEIKDEPLKEGDKGEESPPSEKWCNDAKTLYPQAVAFVNTFLSQKYF